MMLEPEMDLLQSETETEEDGDSDGFLLGMEDGSRNRKKEEEDIQREMDGLRTRQKLSSLLNLLSTLLYMTNYYIVAP